MAHFDPFQRSIIMSQAGIARSRILGVGAYAPDRVMHNTDLEKIVDTSDQWIRERTGIVERRIAAPEQATSDLAAEAARKALANAGVAADEIDLIIVGTVTPDMAFPACAAFVQAALGISSNIPAFDISAACAGFVYGLATADAFIRTGRYQRILVIGAEVLTRIVNWDDRGSCVLFGDGAGAAVVAPADEESYILGTELHTDSSLTASLCMPGGGSREPLTPETIAAKRNTVQMIGSDIFRAAVRNMLKASISVLEESGLKPQDVDWVVPHQANKRIIDQITQRMDVPSERVLINLDRYGNTSSASIPLALAEAAEDGRLKKGDLVLLTALGAGVSWGSCLLRW